MVSGGWFVGVWCGELGWFVECGVRGCKWRTESEVPWANGGTRPRQQLHVRANNRVEHVHLVSYCTNVGTVILVGISLLCLKLHFNKRCTSQGEKECTSTLVPLYDGVYDTLIDNIDHDIDTLELGLDNYICHWG